jgi:hypothetical protein
LPSLPAAPGPSSEDPEKDFSVTDDETGLVPIPIPTAEEVAMMTTPQLRTKRQEDFLMMYRRSGTIRSACKLARLRREVVDNWRSNDKIFREKVQRAELEYTEYLERIAFQRAESKSDLLLMFTLKKRDPSYRENFKMEHSGEVALRVVRYDGATPDNAALPAPPTVGAIDTTAEGSSTQPS